MVIASYFHYNHWVEVSLLYTFGSRFIYKCWVEVCLSIPLVRVLIINVGSGFAIKSEFYLSWVYIPILFLGLSGVSIEVVLFGIRA
jgi:hypothetical protein